MAKQYALTERDLSRLQRVIRWVERHMRDQSPPPRRRPPVGFARTFIAEVDSAAAGGGYYNCHLQSIDADDWNTDTADQFDDVGDSVVIMNISEVGANRHELDAGNKIICWQFTDDEGNVRYCGLAALYIGTKFNTVSDASESLGGKFIYNWFGEW